MGQMDWTGFRGCEKLWASWVNIAIVWDERTLRSVCECMWVHVRITFPWYSSPAHPEHQPGFPTIEIINNKVISTIWTWEGSRHERITCLVTSSAFLLSLGSLSKALSSAVWLPLFYPYLWPFTSKHLVGSFESPQSKAINLSSGRQADQWV